MIEHGDCFELVKTIPAGSVDFVCTDPPYGRTDAPWDVAPDYEKLFPELWRVLKPNGAIVVTSTLPEAVRVIESAKRFFRYDLIDEEIFNTARDRRRSVQGHIGPGQKKGNQK